MKRKRTAEPDDLPPSFPPPVASAMSSSLPDAVTGLNQAPAALATDEDGGPERTSDGQPFASTHRHVVTSASVIMLGNLLSSVLGMLRLLTISTLFYGGASGSFNTALRPVQQVSDLVVGGSVSGALIPTFVDYAAEQRRAELCHVYCTIANLVVVLMALGCAVIFFAAPYFIPLETQGYSTADQHLAIQLVRITSLSLLGLGLYSVAAALLYALKQVKYPAFATGIYHVGIIVCGTLVLLFALRRAGVPIGNALHPGAASPAVTKARYQGADGLAIGAAIGAMGEFLLLIPALRRVIRIWRPVFDLRHPAVRQIMRLYAPLAVGLILSVAAQNLDLALTNLTPGGSAQNLTSMVSA
ncbi:MAG TPA: lipid II flippase MurJ, partial [Ktedonobacterales bacterium]|nr:lipid II flippase MurJ [Ktedonobacterales bacterium]